MALSHKCCSVSTFRFRDRFPNASTMLNQIIDNDESVATDTRRRKLDLDTIVSKMIEYRKKKNNVDLIIADYVVGIFIKMGLTKQMVITLGKDAQKIIRIANAVNNAQDTPQKGGGNFLFSRTFYTLGFIILICIIINLLGQINIPNSTMEPILADALQYANTEIANLQRSHASHNCNATDVRTDDHTDDRTCRGIATGLEQFNQRMLFLNENRTHFTANNVRTLFFRGYGVSMDIARIMPKMTVMFIIVDLFIFFTQCDIIYTNVPWRYLYNIITTDQVRGPQAPARAPAPAPVQPRIDSAIPRVRPLDINPGDDDVVPGHFLCPLSLEIMSDPVTALDGYTYDRAYITRALQINPSSPLSRARMTAQILVPNLILRGEITAWWEDLQRKKAAAAAAAAAEAATTAKRNTAKNTIVQWYRTRKINRASKPRGGSRRRRYKPHQTKQRNQK